MGKILRQSLNWKNMQQMIKMTEGLGVYKSLDPRGLSATAPGLYMYMTIIFKTSSAQKPLGQSILNYVCIIHGSKRRMLI